MSEGKGDLLQKIHERLSSDAARAKFQELQDKAAEEQERGKKPAPDTQQDPAAGGGAPDLSAGGPIEPEKPTAEVQRFIDLLAKPDEFIDEIELDDFFKQDVMKALYGDYSEENVAAGIKRVEALIDRAIALNKIAVANRLTTFVPAGAKRKEHYAALQGRASKGEAEQALRSDMERYGALLDKPDELLAVLIDEGINKQALLKLVYGDFSDPAMATGRDRVIDLMNRALERGDNAMAEDLIDISPKSGKTRRVLQEHLEQKRKNVQREQTLAAVRPLLESPDKWVDAMVAGTNVDRTAAISLVYDDQSDDKMKAGIAFVKALIDAALVRGEDTIALDTAKLISPSKKAEVKNELLAYFRSQREAINIDRRNKAAAAETAQRKADMARDNLFGPLQYVGEARIGRLATTDEIYVLGGGMAYDLHVGGLPRCTFTIDKAGALLLAYDAASTYLKIPPVSKHAKTVHIEAKVFGEDFKNLDAPVAGGRGPGSTIDDAILDFIREVRRKKPRLEKKAGTTTFKIENEILYTPPNGDWEDMHIRGLEPATFTVQADGSFMVNYGHKFHLAIIPPEAGETAMTVRTRFGFGESENETSVALTGTAPSTFNIQAREKTKNFVNAVKQELLADIDRHWDEISAEVSNALAEVPMKLGENKTDWEGHEERRKKAVLRSIVDTFEIISPTLLDKIVLELIPSVAPGLAAEAKKLSDRRRPRSPRGAGDSRPVSVPSVDTAPPDIPTPPPGDSGPKPGKPKPPTPDTGPGLDASGATATTDTAAPSLTASLGDRAATKRRETKEERRKRKAAEKAAAKAAKKGKGEETDE